MSATAEATNGRYFADVGARRIARVYAEALYKAADQQGAVDEILEQFDSLLNDVLPADPDFGQFFASAAVPVKVKKQAIEAALRGRGSDLFVNFLQVLNEHGRLDLLRVCYLALREYHDERRRVVRGVVTSVSPLDEGQRQRIIEMVRGRLNLEPVLQERQDPKLLGGLVIEVAGWRFDGSVRNRLDMIRNHLIERSSHEIQQQRDLFSSD